MSHSLTNNNIKTRHPSHSKNIFFSSIESPCKLKLKWNMCYVLWHCHLPLLEMCGCRLWEIATLSQSQDLHD